MKRWELLDTAEIPGSGGQLRLYQRDTEHSIMIPGAGELMGSRTHGGEEALAELACARLARHSAPRVLIGGLGVGFTLGAALRRLGPAARVTVAELIPAVVRWNHGPLGSHAGYPLEDPRVTVVEGDVAETIGREPQGWDAILLDVDNGPEGLTRKANDRLYGSAGLAAARQGLRRGGIFAVWSAAPDAAFTKRLKTAGFDVEERQVRAHRSRKGQRHTVWIAARHA